MRRSAPHAGPPRCRGRAPLRARGRVAAACVLLLIVYALVGFLWAPKLLRNALLGGIHDNLGLEARVGEIHRLVADAYRLGRIAGRLNTTINVVREVLTEYPAS